MNTVTIYVFRHGETDWNREQRLQGHTDIPLNEKGRTQAKELSLKLRDLNMEVILSSDLSRARETAEIAIAGLDLPIHQSEALREGNLGKVEGLLKEEALKLLGETSWGRWLSVAKEDQQFVFDGGETKEAHLTRMTTYIENFIHNNQEIKCLGVSTHGGSLRRLIHNCEGAPTEGVPLPNCALYALSFHRNSRQWTFQG